MRERHYISPALLTALRPFFRYSESRDAYILRVVGTKRGPVLKEGPAPEPRFRRAPEQQAARERARQR